MQLAALVRCTHPRKQHLANGLAGLRFHLLDESVKVVHVPTAELVDQRTQQPGVAWPSGRA